MADLSSSPTPPIDLVGSERQRDAATEADKRPGRPRPPAKKPDMEADVELEQDTHRLDERA